MPLPLFSSSPMSRSSVCLWISMPVGVYDQQGHMLPHLYVFNQGDVPFLGSQHLPYASSFSSHSRCCQCCCSSSTPAPVSRSASTALAAAGSPYTPSWMLSRDTTKMAPMAPVTSDSSRDFISSSDMYCMPLLC